MALPTDFANINRITVGSRIEIFVENKLITKFRYGKSEYSLRAVRDRHGVLWAAAIQNLFDPDAGKKISVLENTGLSVRSGALGFAYMGRQIPLTPVGFAASFVGTSYFEKHNCAIALWPDGSIPHWTRKSEFDRLDWKILNTWLLFYKDRKAFYVESAKQHRNKLRTELKKAAKRALALAQTDPTLGNLEDAEYRLREALDAFPFQVELLKDLKSLQGEIVTTLALVERRRKTHREMQAIVGNLRFTPEQMLVELAGYINSKEVTPLDVRNIIRFIWDGANGASLVNSVRLSYVFRHIHAILAMVSPEKAYRALAFMWRRRGADPELLLFQAGKLLRRIGFPDEVADAVLGHLWPIFRNAHYPNEEKFELTMALLAKIRKAMPGDRALDLEIVMKDLGRLIMPLDRTIATYITRRIPPEHLDAFDAIFAVEPATSVRMQGLTYSTYEWKARKVKSA